MDLKQAEASVIGGMLMFPEETVDVFQKLTANCFGNETLRKVFAICSELHNKGKCIDVVTVSSQMESDGNLVVAKCCEITPSLTGFEDYVSIVCDGWRKRTLGAVLMKAAVECESPELRTADIVGEVRTAIEQQDEIDRTIKGESAKAFSDAFCEFYTELGKPDTSLKTGWKAFDSVMGGFQPGGVYALSARSGEGKTDFMVNLAMLLSRSSSVLYCSMEMPRSQLMLRVVSRATRINNYRMRDKKLTGEEYAEINRAYNLIKDHTSLVLDEAQNLDMAAVESKILRYGAKVIIIDHLGLMKHPQRRAQWEGISETTKALKSLALKYQIVIFELIQLARETDRKKGAPVMADLRGGGSIEADADGVLAITSEETQDHNTGRVYRLATIRALKNRHGARGDVRFNYWPMYSLFVPIDNTGDKGGDREF